jgi:tight adherence protein C
MNPTILLGLGVGAIFAALLLALVAMTGSTKQISGVGRSLAAIQALGDAPQAMRGELEPSFNDRVVAPLMARLVMLGRRMTPADNAARIQHKLDVAGNPSGWTVDRVVSFKLVGSGVGLLVGLVASALFGFGLMPRIVVCVAFTMLGYVAVNLWLYQQGYERTGQMQKDLPDALDLLTISVEAGLGFDAALSQVARNTTGAVAAEFARVLQEMQIGMGRSQAMRALGERTSLPELRGFANAMTQADSFGIPIGKVLRVQSQEMRLKRRQRAEEMAQKVPVKMLFPLMFCILPCLFTAVLGPAAISIMGSFTGKL